MVYGVTAKSTVDVVYCQTWRELMDISDYPLKIPSFLLCTLCPPFHTDLAAFLSRDLLCSCTWMRGCPWSPRMSPMGPGFPLTEDCRVIEFVELCTFFQVRSCDFPDSDMCLLPFKACYADLSCENGCSQLRWRCFCHMSWNETSDFTPGEASNWFKFSMERWKLFSA